MDFIEFLKYLFLGLIQGITEPLPISSSGHTLIFKELFKLDGILDNNFNTIVNFGSFIAIVIYYRKLIWKTICGTFKFVFKKDKENKDDFNYFIMIVIATIPAVIVGLILKITGFDDVLDNILTVGIGLFITGMLLIFIDKMDKKTIRDNITAIDALLMGCSQCIGLIPGISRSGSTTSIGVLRKVNLEPALRFSFMMYLPASLGAFILGISELISATNIFVWGYIASFIASIIGTYIAVNLFFKLVKGKNLKYFGYYCLGISIVVLMLIAFGVFTI